MVSFLRSFGSNSETLPERDNYLPFKFIDTNSPKYKLRQKLSTNAIELTNRLIEENKIPPKILKVLYSVEGFLELLEEEKNDNMAS